MFLLSKTAVQQCVSFCKIIQWESFRRQNDKFARICVVNLNRNILQIIYIIYNLLGGEWIVAPKIKDIKKSRKRSVYGTFGTLRGTRTLDLLVRSQSLYPTELAARVSKNIKMLAVCTQIDLAVRSQSLYPAELPAHMQVLFTC